jgi:dolichol-phosphate mannosyltransferase
MATLTRPVDRVYVDTELVRQLLAELADRKHPAAEPLLRAWMVSLFLEGKISVTELAKLGAASEWGSDEWLRETHLSDLLDKPIARVSHLPEFSVVLPIFNEEENIPELYHRLTDVLESLGDYEIIFVNDGSSDSSAKLIRQFREQDDRVKLLSFSRNFGHQAAITAGIDYSRGKAVMLLDADLQDPPELLADMVAKWREGFDVVYGVRQKRKENFLKRGAYFLFYRLLRILANIDIPLDSGDFCLMDRAVVEQLKLMPERNRFLRGLRSWIGYQQVALPYERQARRAGAPKYNLRKLIKLALDGIFSFSSFPLRLASYLGFLMCFAGAVYLCYGVAVRLISGAPQGWASTIGFIMLLGGTQLMLLGVLGEYVARIYEESKRRPCYVISEFLN